VSTNALVMLHNHQVELPCERNNNTFSGIRILRDRGTRKQTRSQSFFYRSESAKMSMLGRQNNRHMRRAQNPIRKHSITDLVMTSPEKRQTGEMMSDTLMCKVPKRKPWRQTKFPRETRRSSAKYKRALPAEGAEHGAQVLSVDDYRLSYCL
jgi:hypothetical protein